jgi:hypothetical protein
MRRKLILEEKKDIFRYPGGLNFIFQPLAYFPN